MKVKVADVLGNEKSLRVGFSWLYLFFGPFYLLGRGKVFSFLALILVYYYCLPVPGMNYIADFVSRAPFWTSNNIRAIHDTLLFFRQVWYVPFNYIGIAIVVLIHITLSFTCEGPMCKRYMRSKMLFPASEEDARKLIQVNAARYDVKLAPKNGIQSLYGYKSAEQLWQEQNQIEATNTSTSTYEHNAYTSPLLNALAPLPKDEKIRRRDHYNKLLKNREITVDEYNMLVRKLTKGE